jgi:hypothetical protein
MTAPVDDDRWKASRADIKAMASEDLLRGLFATTSTARAAADLNRYRTLSTQELVRGLLSDEPSMHGSCKRVLAERMAAAGSDDIVAFFWADCSKRRN